MEGDAIYQEPFEENKVVGILWSTKVNTNSKRLSSEKQLPNGHPSFPS